MNQTLIRLMMICLLAMYAGTAHASKWDEYECGPGWGPTKSSAPKYPRRAQQLGITGYIVMNFSVNQDGLVEDISVAEAEPPKAFVRAATKAVQSLEFPPCMTNGLARKVTNVSIKYDFGFEG